MRVGWLAESSRLGYPLSRGQSFLCKRFKTRLPRVEFGIHQIRILFESQLYGTIKSDDRKPISTTERLQKQRQVRLEEH